MVDEDFYEDDQPADEVRAAFARGKKGLTAPPRDLNQRAAGIVGAVIEMTEDEDDDLAGAVVVGNVSASFSGNRMVQHRAFAGSLGRS